MFYGLIILFGIAFVLLLLLVAAIARFIIIRPPRRTVAHMLANGYPTDPAEAGFVFEDFSWVDSQNTPRDGWCVQGQYTNGPTIIMLHGWGDSKYGLLNWLPTVGLVASKLIMIDQRGHGDCIHMNCTWGQRESTDVISLVKHLREENAKIGIDEKVILMGFSMGAAVSVLAYQNGVQVDGLILESPYRQAKQAIDATIKLRSLPGFLSSIICSRLFGRGSQLLHLDIMKCLATPPSPPTPPTPILILHGADDAIVPLNTIAQGVEHLHNVQLVVFENSGHLQAACADPSHFVDVLNNYVLKVMNK